jgi:hypothetical protein
MDKTQSGRPANASRPARRSLAEFALPPSGAPVEIPSATRPVLPGKPAKKASDEGIKIIHEPSDLQAASAAHPEPREPEIVSLRRAPAKIRHLSQRSQPNIPPGSSNS